MSTVAIISSITSRKVLPECENSATFDQTFTIMKCEYISELSTLGGGTWWGRTLACLSAGRSLTISSSDMKLGCCNSQLFSSVSPSFQSPPAPDLKGSQRSIQFKFNIQFLSKRISAVWEPRAMKWLTTPWGEEKGIQIVSLLRRKSRKFQLPIHNYSGIWFRKGNWAKFQASTLDEIRKWSGNKCVEMVSKFKCNQNTTRLFTFSEDYNYLPTCCTRGRVCAGDVCPKFAVELSFSCTFVWDEESRLLLEVPEEGKRESGFP